MSTPPNIALWLSTPNHILVEMALANDYTTFVLDFEHGIFDIATTDRLVSSCRLAGAKVYAKTQCNSPFDIQQMLDRGCNGVIVPHVDSVEHAHSVTSAAKYPPMGTRSFDGGRCVGFAEASDEYFEKSNSEILTVCMIETANGLAEVERIVEIPTVDALLVGPYDLSLSAGRGKYKNSEEDQTALQRISVAAASAGKPWWMPAWSQHERASALKLGAACLVVEHELAMFRKGLMQLTKELGELCR